MRPHETKKNQPTNTFPHNDKSELCDDVQVISFIVLT